MGKGPKLGEKKKYNLPHIFIILFFIVLWSGNIDSSSIRQYHRHGCLRPFTAPFASAGMAKCNCNAYNADNPQFLYSVGVRPGSRIHAYYGSDG